MTKNDIIMKRPASTFGERWRDGTPLGNGLTGVNLYGGISREVFIISRHDMWIKGKNPPPPKLEGCIDRMRGLMKENRYLEASSLMYHELDACGYRAEAAHMRCLCQVVFELECKGVYSDYTRTLHMDTAEADITYQINGNRNRRRTFVSRKEDMVVSSFMFDAPLNMRIYTGFYESGEEGREEYARESDSLNAEYRIMKHCYIYSSQNDDGTFFGLGIRLVSDGKAEIGEQGINIEKAQNVTVCMKAFSQEEDREAAIEKTVKYLSGIEADYERMREHHIKLHKKLYDAADIRLYQGRKFHSNEHLLMQARETECSLELLDRLWHFGRYLFISGVHEAGDPFPLYGLWCSGYERIWSQHVANENVQLIYSHATVGGLSSLVKGLIHYYYKKMERFREVALHMYGCRGIFVSTYTTPRNSSVMPYVPVILHYVGTAGWLARHFYEYYLATGDEILLEKEILPFMLETAVFYEDYLYEDKDGFLEMYPCVSPENTPLEYESINNDGLGHPMPVTKNATMEIAILKELLTNLVALAEEREELSQKAEKWKDMLRRLPSYLINDDGAVAEWIDESVHDNYFHRHLSHLYPIYPGTEIEDSGDIDLVECFRKAVDLRKIGSMTGWSLVHMSAIYARLGEKEKAFEAVNMLTKVCLLDNFFTLHNDYRNMGITMEFADEKMAPVQLDALMGTVNAVQEMLLRITKKKVYILPACSERMSRGRVRGLCFFGGTVDFKWNLEQKRCEIKISADRDVSFELVLPFENGSRNISIRKGEAYYLKEGM